MKTFRSFNRRFAGAALIAGLWALGLGLWTPPEAAAHPNFDIFGQTRTVIVVPATNFFQSGSTAITITNGTVDLKDFLGVVQFGMCVTTNGLTNANNLQKFSGWLEHSTDNTNWASLTTAASSTQTAINETNFNYGGTIVTNQVLLPGTITTPGASVQPGSYLSQAQYTNAGIFCTNVAAGWFTLGVPAQTLQRYVRVIETATGTNAVFSVGVIATGRRKYD